MRLRESETLNRSEARLPSGPALDGLTGLKRQWTDRALDDLASFANSRGGALLLGIRNDGEIVGTQTDDKMLQRIADLIASHLGIALSIQVVEMEGRPVIEIKVETAWHLVSYGARYLRRVGRGTRYAAAKAYKTQ